VRLHGAWNDESISAIKCHVGCVPHTKQLPQQPARVDPDLINRMRVYRVACELVASAWDDAAVLANHPITTHVAPQLYAAVASIAANIGEGYSRSSGRDRARIFEYALGSARESVVWYQAAKILSEPALAERLAALDEIKRMLLAIIPRERSRLIRPGRVKPDD
jgi:four helix bundle protein